MSSLRRVGVNAGWLLGGKAFGGVLSLGYLALATRTLGLADFGRFALVVAIAQGIAGFAGFQTWQFVVRYAMPSRAADDDAGVERVIAFAAVLDLAAALVGCGLAAAAVILLGPMLGLSRDLYPAAIGFCVVVLVATRSTPTGVLRLDDRFRDAALADAVTPVVRAIGAGVSALAMPTVTGFLLTWAASELITAAVFWWAALRQRRLRVSLAGLRRVSSDEPDLWRFVWATNIGSSLALTTKQVTLIAVGAVAGPAAAGTFRLAAQLATALAKLSQSFARAAYSELVRALATGTGRDHVLMIRLTLVATAVAAAMVGLTAVVGEPLLRLIAGGEFTGAYWPMVLLVGAAGLDLGGFAFEPAMTARGRAGAVVWVRVAVAVAQVALLATLLPPFGVVGGAWATLGASAVALVLLGRGAFAGGRRD